MNSFFGIFFGSQFQVSTCVELADLPKAHSPIITYLVIDQLIVIGGLKFFVTIHVVPNAPFSLILGTPFCAIASIEISYRPSSEMVVKITDPNTEKTVLIPGSAKPRRAVAFARSVDSPKDF